MTEPRLPRDRWATLARALRRDEPDLRDPARAVAELIDPSRLDEVWLGLAVLTGRLPDETEVVESARSAQLERGALWRAVTRLVTTESLHRVVRVVEDGVVVDVTHTAQVPRMSGIQRVAREVSRRWMDRPGVVPIVRTADGTVLRHLTPAEQHWIVYATPAGDGLSHLPTDEVVIPWRSRYLLPELALDRPPQVSRLRALARVSGNRFGAIGFDLIPLTSAESAASDVPGLFSVALTVLREAGVVTTISGAAAVEYRGWRQALAAVGRPGPEIRVVELPVEAFEVDAADLERTRDRLLVPGMPMVLVVGSHEPRKNHIAVLRAADLLWRQGHRFSLTFIGAPGWNHAGFDELFDELGARGMPVDLVTEAPEAMLWAAYRLARFTVFPSLNEGFGLPVAESLAVGTPAITSAYGSTAEIAAGGGALTIDPRDTFALVEAMRSLLDDDVLLGRLRSEAVARPSRTWEQYATETWDALVQGESVWPSAE
jgi:glycosyltransferase involved in cell wall biosynthesis